MLHRIALLTILGLVAVRSATASEIARIAIDPTPVFSLDGMSVYEGQAREDSSGVFDIYVFDGRDLVADGTAYVEDDGTVLLVTNAAGCPATAGSVSSVGISEDGVALIVPLPDEEEEKIKEIDLDKAPKDVRTRIEELQVVPVREIDGAGNNEFKPYKNNTDPKLPAGGDYQEIYVKDKDADQRLVYDWKNKKLYYTPDHYETWVEIDEPWGAGGPKFFPPM